MSRIVIVIPDAGPLITLAKADALELLLSFSDDVRLVLTDVVEFECTRFRSDHLDAQKICDFIAANPSRIDIQNTSYGEQAISAAKVRQRYDENPAVQALFAANNLPAPAKMAVDSGEMSIISFISGLIAAPPGTPCLIIAEDDFFLRSNSGALPGNAHIISTVAFLKAVEARVPMFSAQAVLDVAASADRKPSPVDVDKPAEKIKGGTTRQPALQSSKLKSVVARRDKRLGKSRSTKP